MLNCQPQATAQKGVPLDIGKEDAQPTRRAIPQPLMVPAPVEPVKVPATAELVGALQPAS
jgi:hypothetical protein